MITTRKAYFFCIFASDVGRDVVFREIKEANDFIIERTGENSEQSQTLINGIDDGITAAVAVTSGATHDSN